MEDEIVTMGSPRKIFSNAIQIRTGVSAVKVTIRGFGFRPKPFHALDMQCLRRSVSLIDHFIEELGSAGIFSDEVLLRRLRLGIPKDIYSLDRYQKAGYIQIPIKRRWRLKRPNQFNKNGKAKYLSKAHARYERQRKNHRPLSMQWFNGQKTYTRVEYDAGYRGYILPVRAISWLFFLCEYSELLTIMITMSVKRLVDVDSVMAGREDLDIYCRRMRLHLCYIYWKWLNYRYDDYGQPSLSDDAFDSCWSRIRSIWNSEYSDVREFFQYNIKNVPEFRYIKYI